MTRLLTSVATRRRRAPRGLLAAVLFCVLTLSSAPLPADCSGVTPPVTASGLSSVSMGAVVVTQAFLPDGVTPSPLSVTDCMGVAPSPPELFIPWSGDGADPPATFHIDAACPAGAEGIIITASGSAGPSAWSAFDGAGVLLD